MRFLTIWFILTIIFCGCFAVPPAPAKSNQLNVPGRDPKDMDVGVGKKLKANKTADETPAAGGKNGAKVPDIKITKPPQ